MDVVSYLLGKNASGGGGGGEYTLAVELPTTAGINRLSSAITKVSPNLDTSQMISTSYLFDNFTSLTEIPLLNTSNVRTASYMFNNCTSLTTIPILNFTNVINSDNIFKNCPSFTDQTLDNILVMLMGTNMTVSFYKKLSQQGFTSTDYPASRIQALPHYQDFVAAGWSIGY